MMKRALFIFAWCVVATMVHSDNSTVSIEGTWESECSDVGGNVSVQTAMACSDESCKYSVNIYNTATCIGIPMNRIAASIKYKIEENVSDNLYNVILYGPDSTSCYARIKIETDKFYLLKPAGDCSTPEGRLAETNEVLRFHQTKQS